MKKFEGYNGKRINKFLLVCLLAISSCSKTVSAESITYILPGGGKIYSFQDIMSRCESYGLDYQVNNLQNELQAAKALTAEETYTDAYSDYLNIEAKIQELKATKENLTTTKNELLAQYSGATVNESDSSESSTDRNNENESSRGNTAADINTVIAGLDTELNRIETELASYQKSADTLGRSSSDAKLSQDLAEFYKTYQGLLTQEGKNKARHGFIQNCLNLIIDQEGIKYYAINQEYIKLQKQIEETKYQHGFSTKARVDDIFLNLKESDSLSFEKLEDYDFLIAYVKRETGIADNDTIQYDIPLNLKSYTVTNTVNSFMENVSSYLQLKNMETSYQAYLSSGAMTSTAYRHQIELTVESYKLQRLQLERQIEDYVKKAINSYAGAFRKMESTKTELDVADNKCKTIEDSFRYKRATEMDVKKAYLDKQSVSLKFYNSCKDVVLWEDILDNNIYLVN